MRLLLITAPTEEAVTIDEAKQFLRESSDDFDAYIDGLIMAARTAYEDWTGCILMYSTWDMYLDEFPESFELPAPLVSVTSVKYQDTSDVQQTVTAAYYVVDTISEPVARIALASGQSWPDTYGELNDVVVRFVAGWTAIQVPQIVKQGTLLWIAQQYDGQDRSAAWQALWGSYRRFPV